MKYFLVGIFIVSLLVGYVKFQKGRFSIDNERAGVMLLKGGYRAWWIRYSEGTLWASSKSKHKKRTFYRRNKKGDLEKVTRHYDFKPKTMWCRPRFEHCDVRPLMEMRGEK